MYTSVHSNKNLTNPTVELKPSTKTANFDDLGKTSPKALTKSEINDPVITSSRKNVSSTKAVPVSPIKTVQHKGVLYNPSTTMPDGNTTRIAGTTTLSSAEQGAIPKKTMSLRTQPLSATLIQESRRNKQEQEKAKREIIPIKRGHQELSDDEERESKILDKTEKNALKVLEETRKLLDIPRRRRSVKPTPSLSTSIKVHPSKSVDGSSFLEKSTSADVHSSQDKLHMKAQAAEVVPTRPKQDTSPSITMTEGEDSFTMEAQPATAAPPRPEGNMTKGEPVRSPATSPVESYIGPSTRSRSATSRAQLSKQTATADTKKVQKSKMRTAIFKAKERPLSSAKTPNKAKSTPQASQSAVQMESDPEIEIGPETDVGQRKEVKNIRATTQPLSKKIQKTDKTELALHRVRYLTRSKARAGTKTTTTPKQLPPRVRREKRKAESAPETEKNTKH